MRRLQSLRSGHGDVRFHADMLPVGFGDHIGRARGRDRDNDVLPQVVPAHGIGAAPGGFADHRAALLRLDAIGEILPAGKRAGRGQYVHGLVVTLCDRLHGPELPRQTCRAVVHVDQVTLVAEREEMTLLARLGSSSAPLRSRRPS